MALAPEPFALPAGQTLGDALPQVPPAAPLLRAGGGPVAAGTLQAKTGCAQDAPDEFSLAKRLEIAYPAAKEGAPSAILEVCLLQKTLDRQDKVAQSGKQFEVVAAFADDSRAAHTFDETTRPAKTLPPERQASGHDGGGWAGLIATGDPDRPVLAVVSGRFYDGALGEEVHFVRHARLLQKVGAAWAWQPLVERAHSSLDVEHLRALCGGKADASAADKAAGALQAACDRLQLAEGDAAKTEARLALRKRRLNGLGGGKPESDADPQAIWLRDAKAQLAANDADGAVQTALKVDAVCGEPVGEAHGIIRDALAARKAEPVRAMPAQPVNDVCEPLPDKPAPKRPREKIEVPDKPDAGSTMGGKGPKAKPAPAKPAAAKPAAAKPAPAKPAPAKR